ncbi:MAG: hypothetical protein AAGA70_19255 [Pseudomonadota bacterium]
MSPAAVLTLVEIWLWIGAAVAAAFLFVGIDRIDEDARGAYVFRPLLVPGILLIWPLVLWRWWVLETGRDQWRARHMPPRIAHRAASVFLAAAILALIIAGVVHRPPWDRIIEPVQLSEAGS